MEAAFSAEVQKLSMTALDTVMLRQAASPGLGYPRKTAISRWTIL